MSLFSGAFALLLLGAQIDPQECGNCHTVDLARFEKSVHGPLGCQGCHTTVTALPHAGKPRKAECATCHAEAFKAYAASVHGSAQKNGDADSATCVSCHGSPHEVVPRSDGASKVAKKNLADTCGKCHSDPGFLSRHKIPFAKPVEAYRLSVHGRAVAKGSDAAASCSDCHGAHDIQGGRDRRSKTEHGHISNTCGKCHSEVQKVYESSIHGTAVKAGSLDSPVCTDCHGEHTILAPAEPGSLVNPARVSTATCGRCHSDERLATRYDLPWDKMPTFQDSYHGLALRGGQKTVANCASCHGVHNILASHDPKSTIHPKNLGQTCGRCHPGVGSSFTSGPIHVRSATVSEHKYVRWIRVTYWILIPLTIGFMVFHNAIDWLAKLRRGRQHHGGTGEMLPRMNLRFRVTHALAAVSFLVLIVTGFALKFPEAGWVKLFLAFDPTSAFRGLTHRIAAVVLMASSAYHGLHLLLDRRDRKILWHLWPNLQDAKDILGMIKFNLGLSGTRPTFDTFSYAEKMEYWAYWWGTVVMAVTGILLWAENWSLRYLPKWVMDAATAAHWYEAILATLSILVWHWYLVIFDPDVYPMEMTWLDGKVSGDHLRETRPEYYRHLVEQQEAAEGGAGDPPQETGS
ncbi:MAG: cytochrome b/b6 domain-containing protein [Acidobacteria bacterium]|nr:cytochrome b/b6 domain-containing protein [Acidobacteriota bacterium]